MSDDEFMLYVIEPDDSNGPAPASKLTSQNELHSAIWNRRKARGVDSATFEKSWANTQKALKRIISDSKEDEAQGLRLDELEVSLTLSGEAGIGFASGKAEASIVLKFARAGADKGS